MFLESSFANIGYLVTLDLNPAIVTKHAMKIRFVGSVRLHCTSCTYSGLLRLLRGELTCMPQTVRPWDPRGIFGEDLASGIFHLQASTTRTPTVCRVSALWAIMLLTFGVSK